jgi:hypothetical protein
MYSKTNVFGKAVFLFALCFLALFFWPTGFVSADTSVGENESLIVVNRKDGTHNDGLILSVSIDGKEQLKLKNGESGQVVVPNGSHTISTKFDMKLARSTEMRFTAESKQITFEIGYPRFLAATPSLTKTSELIADKGIYIGIVSAGANAEDLTGGQPVYLGATGYSKLLNILDSNYRKTSQQGTALYYGVHKALAALAASAGQYAFDMDAVNLVTFTDGLDNNSTSLGLQPIENQNFGGKQPREYQSYIRSQIESRRVFGKNITAYSIGVPGGDVTDRTAFTSSLQSLASEGRNFFEMGNFSELRSKFGEIASRLSTLVTNMTFTVSTPSYPIGTKIRMTFDVPGGDNDGNAAANSARYLQGEVAVNGGTYALTNISYGGNIGSAARGTVTGVLSGTEVNYTFPGFTGYNSAQDTVKQWSRSDSPIWQINSEYRLGEAVKTTSIERSMIIYLVLDNSNSLQDNDVIAIREAAKSFIGMLYNTTR